LDTEDGTSGNGHAWNGKVEAMDLLEMAMRGHCDPSAKSI
jgi:hypothetical protein